MTTDSHDGGRGVRDQIERYRTAFIAVVTMIVIAVGTAGFILSHERLALPGWVPIFGKEYFTLKGEFQTGESLTPGQGQSVTIAGAQIGEISSVSLHNGVALVSMHIKPKFAKYIYRNATMLMRPKTQVKDMIIEVDPGTRTSGKLQEDEIIPRSQTAPDVNLDEFLASLDGETRAYLQELLAAGAQGIGKNGRQLSAVFKRFDPTARITQEITHELKLSHTNIARAIHNFQLLSTALGGTDKQLSEGISASNAVFKTFTEQDQHVQETIHLLPSALNKTKEGLGKLATAANVAGPTLTKLLPFAHDLAPAEKEAQPFLRTTTPIFKNQIRPFARQILPVVNKISPAIQNLAESFPDLEVGFSVFNEFFNELAYNPTQSKGNFLFFLDWANHNFNSVLSSADADSTLGHTLLYFNCEVTPLLEGAAKVNKQVNLILGLLNPPTPAECKAHGLSTLAGVATAKASAHSSSTTVNTKLATIASRLFGGTSNSLAHLGTVAGGGR